MAAGFLNALGSIPQGFMQGQQYAIDQNYQQALRELAIQQQRQQLAQNLQNQQTMGLFYRAYGSQPQQQQQNPNPFGQPIDLQAAQQFTPPPQIPQRPPQPLVPPAVLNRPPTPAMLPTIADKESSGGKNLFNPTPTSSGNAEGKYGITTGTWKDFAPKAGVNLAKYPEPNAADFGTQARVAQQIPLRRWDPKTVAAVQQLPPEHQQAASQTAVTAAASMPPQLAGQLEPQQLKQMIENAAEPGTPDAVKGAALVQLQHLMKPDAAQQLQLYEFATRQAQHKEDKDQQAAQYQQTQSRIEMEHQENLDLRRDLAQQGKGSDWQVYQTPEGFVRANRATGSVEPMALPQGSGKLGASQGPPPDDKRVSFWADIMKKGMPMPAGLSRTAVGSRFVQAVMNKMADDGIAISQNAAGDYIANVATVKADQSSLNNLTRQADAATSFERTANANLDTALRLSQGAVPTDLGPWVNKWIETGSTQFGGTEVPPYTAAVLTAANEYAKIMNGSTGSQGSTVDSRREAAEMLSPYLSQGQIEAVAGVLKKDMANRRNSMYGQIEDVKQSLRTGEQRFPTGSEASGTPAQSGPPEVTPEQYEQLPPNAPYRVPGKSTIFYKQ